MTRYLDRKLVKSEEEFIEKIKDTIGENYNRETDHLLDHEIQHHYVDHTKINMPDKFLKNWLKHQQRTGDRRYS